MVLRDALDAEDVVRSPEDLVKIEIRLDEERATLEPGSRMRPRTMAAIPCYNEEPYIGSVVLQARRYVDHVVVIDDGSSDKTSEVARLAGAHVIRHSRNLGKGMAIRSAFLYAREAGPEALVLLDGDCQHDPEDLPAFFDPILEDGVDVTLGVRWGKETGMPKYRRVGKRVLDYATSAGVKNGMVTDSQCGYRGFSKRAYMEIEPVESGLGVESQMLFEVQENGFRVEEVDIGSRYDLNGSTCSPGRHGFGVLGSIVNFVSRKRPLFFFGAPGAVLTLAALALALVTVQVYYATGDFAIGYALLVLLLGTVGILSVFTGIILNAMNAVAKG